MSTRAGSGPVSGSPTPTEHSLPGDESGMAGDTTCKCNHPATAWRRYGAAAWQGICVIVSLAGTVTKILDWWFG